MDLTYETFNTSILDHFLFCICLWVSVSFVSAYSKSDSSLRRSEARLWGTERRRRLRRRVWRWRQGQNLLLNFIQVPQMTIGNII